MKPHKLITNREFKLLIKPAGLDRRTKVLELSELIVKFCKKNQVEFLYLNNATTGLRNICFYDTPAEDFRRNNLILRVRESRQNVWVDDWCEVTMKCRSHELDLSSKFNPVPKTKSKARIRFKEEILRGDGLGTMRSVYSNNSILDAIPIDQIFETSYESVIKFFPGLEFLKLKRDTPIKMVGGSSNKILEACLPIGTLVFGDGVQAHCDIAIWMRSVGDPIVGELSFSYRVNEENRAVSKAHKRADQFFQKLQIALSKWLEIGSTKTALVYGKPE